LPNTPLSKSSLGRLGLGPDTAHSPFYLYTRLYLALFTFLVDITINNHIKMFFSFLFFFLLASVRELFTHACYRRRVIKMQGGGELKASCLFLQRHWAAKCRCWMKLSSDSLSAPRLLFFVFMFLFSQDLVLSLLLSFLFIFFLVFISVSSLFFGSLFFLLSPFYRVRPWEGFLSLYSLGSKSCIELIGSVFG
jgi:hypothetical protein